MIIQDCGLVPLSEELRTRIRETIKHEQREGQERLRQLCSGLRAGEAPSPCRTNAPKQKQ